MKTHKPITDKVKRLRQRPRADGSWRIWWEPEADVKALGFDSVQLDPDRPTWSRRQCDQLNADVEQARAAGGRIVKAGARTIAALIREYKTSRKFLKLKPATHRDYQGAFVVIEDKWGPNFVADFTKPVMHAWYETLYSNNGKAMALSMLRKMSILFSHAELLGWRGEGSNPCSKLGMEVPAPRKRNYTWEEFDHIVNTADKMGHPEIACAVGLSMLAGARQTDVREARIDGFIDHTIDGETQLVWQMVRSKKQNLGAIPVHNYFEQRVRNLIDAAAPDQEHLIVSVGTGKPYTLSNFQKVWRGIRAAAAKDMPSLADIQFRDLRRTFGKLSREAGVSKDDVGDVLGNSAAIDPQLGEVYMATSLIRTTRAVTAIARPAKTKKTG